MSIDDYANQFKKPTTSLVQLAEDARNTVDEGLAPIAKMKAAFNKKLKKGEITDLINVALRVKRLMFRDFGFDFERAATQAMKDVKTVNIDNLKQFMDLYKDQY